MNRFYLIHKDGEYRLTDYITETARDNHVSHGWTIVQSWTTKPHPVTVIEAAHIHGWQVAE